ncbi:gas vesicle protein GvpG [Krasilnikovia cinnamomea]|uniref:Gas vesicle protein GvpG n=1 Tax=Krasilnikovia cinnamomea TaxID=349313 RepID=A0A4Q7ZS57_9ACTN|nr:gas vesicle protein GvpG [Krasilnikovia cinnamomea]RZU54002.1 gas vesicle protein GvpG [Krasilnikovia cinnamomea]
MGLVSGLATLPLAPLRGLFWLARLIQDQAATEWDPATEIRRRLAETDLALAAGLITEQECAEAQDLLLARLLPADATPVSGDAAPVTGDAAPVSGDAAPVTGDAAPVSGDAAPVTGDAAPITADSAPTAGGAGPGGSR